MVSSNYSSPYFQPLPSQEVGLVPYIEQPLTPTIDEYAFPYAEYTAQDQMGPYKVNVMVVFREEGLAIEHVANGNLLMRVQIIREKLLNSQWLDYIDLSNKYDEFSREQRDIDYEKIMADSAELLRNLDRRDRELA